MASTQIPKNFSVPQEPFNSRGWRRKEASVTLLLLASRNAENKTDN